MMRSPNFDTTTMDRKVVATQFARRFTAADIFVAFEKPGGMSAALTLKGFKKKNFSMDNRSKFPILSLYLQGLV
jgi:hypothetical protein